MSIKLGVPLLFILLFFANGCDSNSGGAQQQPAPSNAARQQANAAQTPAAHASSAAQTPGACPLIENSEIESLQGAKVSGTLPTTRPDDNFNVSQCYYTVVSADGTKNLSVHLEVTRGNGRTSVKDFWEERFGGEEREEKGERERERKKEGEREREKGRGEEEEESSPPLRVKGIGEEAFWLGSPKAGALYVLKGERVVRVSVGGGDDMNTKIEKSKKLAAAVLKRLS
jgi:hypothetical protein